MSRFCSKRFTLAAVMLTTALTIGGIVAERMLPGVARRLLIAQLEERFQSTIQVGAIDVHGFIPVRI